MAKKKTEMDSKKIGGMLVPAGLLIGIGVGMVYGQIAAGTLIGLGVGFLGAVVVSLSKRI